MIERYTREAMGSIWTDEARMEAWRRVEVAACERRRRVGDRLARPDELEVGMLLERVAQRPEPLAVAGDVDPQALAGALVVAHRVLLVPALRTVS